MGSVGPPCRGHLRRKKGAYSGIDGKLTLSDVGGTVRDVLVSVKSGHVNVSQVRDLKGTMGREGAPMGLFLDARGAA